MSAERLVTNNEERSRHLPPLEAWKQPDRWLDLSTGKVKSDTPLLVLPTDDRGFLRPDQVIDIMVDRFFWKDYDWPYDPDDLETRPDDHHFYYYKKWYKADVNGGDNVPWEFRELPTSIGRMPRQMHNAIHHLTAPPTMPDRDAMDEYIASYEMALKLFRRLQRSINRTVRKGGHTVSPELLDRLPQELDPIAEAFIEGFFTHHFSGYRDAIESFRRGQASEIESLQEHQARITEFAGTLGTIATRSYYNVTPLLQAA